MKGVGFAKRGAFLRKSGPAYDPDRLHLHVICTNEDEYGTLLVVQMCSLEPSTRDRACLLGIGDHPFIDRRSFIHYMKAEILDVPALQDLLKRGDIIPSYDVDEEIFDQVCHGLLSSKWTRPAKVRYFLKSSPTLPEAA